MAGLVFGVNYRMKKMTLASVFETDDLERAALAGALKSFENSSWRDALEA